MKKLAALLVTIATVLTVAGCGETRPESPAPSASGPPPLHSLTLDAPNNGTVRVGATLALKVTARVGTGVADQTKASRFISSEPSIAEVRRGGSVLGLKPGTATVTAQLDGVKSAPVKISVVPVP